MFRQLLTGLIGCVLMALQAAHAQDNFEMVSLTPDGHPNSPTCGHLKFPHPERGELTA